MIIVIELECDEETGREIMREVDEWGLWTALAKAREYVKDESATVVSVAEKLRRKGE